MNKVILYIKDADNVFQQVDLFDDETISVTSKIQDIRDISKVFTDFSQSFTLPASKKNNKIFKHFYNYFISVGAFDARKKSEAVLEINYIPFRRGKIFLNGVKMKNNKPYAYNVTFFGNTVTLTDLFGDDELSSLSFTSFDHNYTDSNVETGLTTGLSGGDVIYPLITHTKRLYFDSTTPTATTLDGNLHKGTNQNSQNIALEPSDLKPAIKVKKIIDAIESKYGIQFVDSDFLSTTPMDNLYMWLSKNKGILGGDEGAEDRIKILGTWTNSSPTYLSLLFPDGQQLGLTGSLGSPLSPASTIVYTLQIVPDSSYTSTQYTVQILRDGNVVAEKINNIGTSTTSITYSALSGGVSLASQSHTFKVITSGQAFVFTPTLTFTAAAWSNGGSEVWTTTPASQNVLSEIIIADQMPKIKVIDFISGILKMFNLTIYYVDDESDADYDKIRILPLDDYYDDNPKIFDITKYIDSSEHDVESTIPFSEIDLEYEKPKTLLMKQHEESFNHIFGDEEFKPIDVDRGKPYKVKLPFEHFKFERLFDEANGNETDIQWGYSAGDNFKPDADATPQPTANYQPILSKPLIFYGIRITGLSGDGRINFYGNGVHKGLTSYWKPSNTNENGTSSTAPAFTLNFDNEIDEFNLTDYDGTTNSLFKKFYQTYIEDAFNAKKRIFKLTAHLPSSVLLNYKLNDRFQIGDKVFTINSIDTNLKTGESKLELLNVL
jgi:hypothetical protein